MAVIQLNNELRALEIQEQKEIEAVLATLSNQLIPYTEELALNLEILTRLDFIFAKAALSRHYKCSEPKFNTDGFIHIKDGRHPLLDPQKVVPITVWLGKDFDLLIITGPNTGGKTVSLKTVGLFTLMGQAGLHIPAFDGSELAVFDEVFADIGDEQSIEQSLSTFSAHMTNIVDILGKADSRDVYKRQMPGMVKNYIAPSAQGNRFDPSLQHREMSIEEIKQYTTDFVKGAMIARRAGFDGVEIHAVHEGYLLDQFAIAIYNHRTDEYGGSLENRLRFATDIVKGIKKACGNDFPVSLRFSLKSCMKALRQGGLPGEVYEEAGRDIEEGIAAAKILEAAGYDALNVDAGTYDSW